MLNFLKSIFLVKLVKGREYKITSEVRIYFIAHHLGGMGKANVQVHWVVWIIINKCTHQIYYNSHNIAVSHLSIYISLDVNVLIV